MNVYTGEDCEKGSNIGETVSAIRIDCVNLSNQISGNLEFEIEYFGFFKTVEDAAAYK